MFDIEFIADRPELQMEGWYALRGRATVGDHVEQFLASVATWSRSDYEREWIEGARRLLNGEPQTAFFTSAFRFWWVMWRAGADVFVQEHFLTPEKLIGLGIQPDLRKTPYELIGPRKTQSEAGERISEWAISLSDLQAFVERRAST